MSSAPSLKNVVVVGGSYVGLNTAGELARVLPEQYRVIVVEKNSHFGHLFAYPRFAVAPEHEHKTFIPFTKSLQLPNRVVQARVTTVRKDAVVLDRAVEVDDKAGATNEIPYEALVLATGTHLASPGTLPLNAKTEGVESLRSFQKRVESARSTLILGGGAVGVQLATDLGVLYPDKEVTLLHSRDQLMPRFHPGLSDLIKKRFEELGVKTILGSRAVVPEGGWPAQGPVTVSTQDGRSVVVDLLQSTGQSPNSQLLSDLAPQAIAQNGFIKVLPSLQIDDGATNREQRIFAVGDIADTGAPKAARPAMAAAGIVARNVLKVLNGSDEDLETYNGAEVGSGIHLTLGVKESVIFRDPKVVNRSTGSKDSAKEYEGEPIVTWKDDGSLDMHIEGVWARRAPGVTDYWA